MTETDGSARRQVIDALAEVVASLRPAHPTRVAIDGNSCSGKTSVADDLAKAVQALGRPTLRASIDDFHCRGYRDRSMRGEWTPQLYFDEGYDYHTFRAWMLEPLGPGGSRRCRPAMVRTSDDALLPEVWHEVSDNAVVIVDGILLLHPELAAHWDYVIWLDVDTETMVERACQRDGDWYGSREAAERRYRQFRQPIYAWYERQAEPSRHADAILDNRDFERPRLVRLRRHEEA
jgi:uridine kinase